MTQTALQKCSYWSLSETEREEVNRSAPDKNAWDFHIRRNDSGTWEFDEPSLKTYGELLLGGTEKVIDFHYQQQSEVIPDEWSSMDMTVSKLPLRHETTSLTYVEPDKIDPRASVYSDDRTGGRVWLCPWLTNIMFDPAPEKLYVHLTLVS